jgi:hypothetical protein
MMVRDFHSVIGLEARAQILERTRGLPDLLVACVGGGSNAMGLFHAFLDDPVAMVGVEAGGESSAAGRHAARFLPAPGRAATSFSGVGVLHGTRTYLLQDAAGNVLPTHSIAAGLDYPAIGPEHALLHDQGRVQYASVSDAEALDAFGLLALSEGVIPALESAHAIAWVVREAAQLRDKLILVNLSGRGDKDLGILSEQGGAASHPPEPPAFASGVNPAAHAARSSRPRAASRPPEPAASKTGTNPAGNSLSKGVLRRTPLKPPPSRRNKSGVRAARSTGRGASRPPEPPARNKAGGRRKKLS